MSELLKGFCAFAATVYLVIFFGGFLGGHSTATSPAWYLSIENMSYGEFFLQNVPFTNYVTGDIGHQWLALTLLGAGLSLIVVSWLILTVKAFQNMTPWGVACALLPPVSFVFGLCYIEKSKPYVVAQYLGYGGCFLGIVFLYLP